MNRPAPDTDVPEAVPDEDVLIDDANELFRSLTRTVLSVVIPAYRRPDSLRRVLDALTAQIPALAVPAEVVVCDDASGDDTPGCVIEVAARNRIPVAWVRHSRNRGPAAARNSALRRARGEVVLLLGDDIEPAPGLLERHCRHHLRNPGPTAALLGRTTWPPELVVTPLMKLLEGRAGALFLNYRALRTDRPLSGMAFYTCNVSYKRALGEQVGGFDESFPFASHEDLEFGLRLERAGMTLRYDPEALGYHWHALAFADTIRRLYRTGYSAVLFWQRMPPAGGFWRRWLRAGLGALGGVRPVRWLWRRQARHAAAGDGAASPALTLALLHGAFWLGCSDGRRGVTDTALMEYGRETGADPAPPRRPAHAP